MKVLVDPLDRIIMVSLGGVLGVNARYWLGLWITRQFGNSFPYSTFFINISGSFFIGLLATLFGRWTAHPYIGLAVVVGFLGGYTTFSSYEIETYWLFERREPIRAIVYMLGSVAGGFAAVLLGVLVARLIAHR
jgi:fluoride exporter